MTADTTLHETSLAVWDVPRRGRRGRAFCRQGRREVVGRTCPARPRHRGARRNPARWSATGAARRRAVARHRGAVLDRARACAHRSRWGSPRSRRDSMRQSWTRRTRAHRRRSAWPSSDARAQLDRDGGCERPADRGGAASASAPFAPRPTRQVGRGPAREGPLRAERLEGTASTSRPYAARGRRGRARRDRGAPAAGG